jgi:hypothetical protein
MIKNRGLFVALVIVLEPIKIDEVCSGVMVGTIVGIMTDLAALKACDIGSIVLVGLCHICMTIVIVVVPVRLEISLLSSLREFSSAVWGSGVV